MPDLIARVGEAGAGARHRSGVVRDRAVHRAVEAQHGRHLMGVEMMLNAVNVTLLGFSRFIESPRPIDGQVFATFVITDRGRRSGGGAGACRRHLPAPRDGEHRRDRPAAVVS